MLRLPVLAQIGEFQQLAAADHVFEFAEAHLGHVFADFLGDEEHEVDDMLRLAGEFLAQLRVLRGDADRAGVQMADAHHDAAGGDQRPGAEAEFLGAEQRADDHIAAGFDLAIGLQNDPAAQVVQHQRLLRFGEAQFPGNAGIFDAGQRRSAGAAAVAADENVIGLGLGDARGDGADADFADQLHADPRLAVDVLQIVNQLRQIFDRINIVMRRRRDQPDARRGVADLADVFIDLVAGKLPALAGLGALGHLDLQFIGVDQIFGGHAESRRGDLLDRAAAPDRRWHRA